MVVYKGVDFHAGRRTAVENNLTFMKENGYVERVGSKETGYWKALE